MRRLIEMVVIGGAWLQGSILGAQVVNPADAQKPPEKKDQDASSTEQPPERLNSYKMPAITVVGEPAAAIREEDRIGSYGQPRWTATRRFPGTRVYVIPEGEVEFEYWLRPTVDKDHPTEVRSLWEVEFGLPYRFQLDLYLRTDQEGDQSEMLLGQQVELRYALADWGRIPGNPTLYMEWVGLEQRPDKVEPKLLLGGEIAPRWHWGFNLVAELELGGDREHEYQGTAGVSYSVIDSKVSVGVECTASFIDTKEDRGNLNDEVFVGPSLQLRPAPQFFLNFAPLFGVTGNSRDAQIYINLGWVF